MALTYEQARRQVETFLDAFNRRDPDAMLTVLHETVTHRNTRVSRHLGDEVHRTDGKDSYREFLRWIMANEPRLRHVLEEVFLGREGYAFTTHGENETRAEDEGKRYVFVTQVDDDGLWRDLHVYHGSPPVH